MTTPSEEEIESYRDFHWRREEERRVETVLQVEELVNEAGLLFTMKDARSPGPSLYTAVCGRRDAHMPRNVQKDPESSLTWRLKDETMKRGRVYYAKLLRGFSTFVAPRLVGHFNVLFGHSRRQERQHLTAEAVAVLKVLRREWEMASSDLREASRLDRKAATRALDELQKCMKVIPSDVMYEPSFTYIWAPSETRFGTELGSGTTRDEAMLEIARSYIKGAGVIRKGELERVVGLSKADAEKTGTMLVKEGRYESNDIGICLVRESWSSAQE